MEPILLIPLTVIFVAALIIGRNQLVKRKLACPTKGTTAEVDVLRRALTPSRLVRVKRCDLLEEPEKIDCGQECLEQGA